MEEIKRSIAEQFADLDNFEQNHLSATSLPAETVDELESLKIKKVDDLMEADLDNLFFNGDLSAEAYEEAGRYKRFIEKCTFQLREDNKVILEASGTLEEKLEQIPDDEWVYVGSHAGWVFIEQCKDLRVDIKKYDVDGAIALEKKKESTRRMCEEKDKSEFESIGPKVKKAIADAEEADKQDEIERAEISEREDQRKLKEKAGNLTEEEQRQIDAERRADEKRRKEIKQSAKNRNRNLQNLEGKLRKEAETKKAKRDENARKIYSKVWKPWAPRKVKKVDTIIALYPHGIAVVVEGTEVGSKVMHQPYEDRYKKAAKAFHEKEAKLRKKMVISDNDLEDDDLDDEKKSKKYIDSFVSGKQRKYYTKKKQRKASKTSANHINTTDISGDDINALIKAIVGDKKKEKEEEDVEAGKR